MGRSDKTSSSAFPWKEFLAFLGVILAAYIGYLGIRSQAEIPIRATQTAEANLTLAAQQFASKETITPQVSQFIPPTESQEYLSHTEYSLSGDAILYFRVIEFQGRTMTIEVDYQYNAQHGEKVMVGAFLKGIRAGYIPAFVPSFLEGTAPLQIVVHEPGASTDIDIFLYEWGRPGEPFARRTFDYSMRFE